MLIPQDVKRFETIAIPSWKNQVAPRFGIADEFTIVAVSRDTIGTPKRIRLSESLCWNEKLTQLKAYGVDVLICSGINQRFSPLAKSLGIEVKCGVCGEITSVLELYCKGDLLFFQTGCVHRRLRRRRGGAGI